MIRRRNRDAQDAVDAEDPEVVEEVVDQEPGLSPRPRGPWDGAEVKEGDGRLDMGALRIRGSDGLQMQVQMDEKSGAVSMVTLSADGGAVQVQAFAAPKSSGIWADVRAQLVNSINSSGGLVEEAAGEFGPELRAKVPGQGGQLQAARFVGVDGPRWFLRGLFLGSAAEPGANATLEGVFRDVVVVRGDEAMAPGDALPLRLPDGAQATRADG